MAKTWQMQLKPKGGEESWNKEHAEEYCIKHNIAGLGWPIKNKVSSIQKAKYSLFDQWTGKRTKQPDGTYKIEDPTPAIRFIEEMKEGDLIWTYHTKESEYYLGKVMSGWKQKALKRQSGNKFLKMDLIWARKVRWQKISRARVPGIIKANPLRCTLCHTKASPEYCSSVYKNPHPRRSSKIRKETFNNRLRPLHPLEIEDLACGYLQHKGWRLIRNSAPKHSRLFEGTFISSKSGKIGYLQVKSKNAKIKTQELDSYKKILKDERDAVIFLYFEIENKKDLMETVKEQMPKTQRNRIIRITYDQIEDYIKKHPKEIGKDLIIRLNLMNRQK